MSLWWIYTGSYACVMSCFPTPRGHASPFISPGAWMCLIYSTSQGEEVRKNPNHCLSPLPLPPNRPLHERGFRLRLRELFKTMPPKYYCHEAGKGFHLNFKLKICIILLGIWQQNVYGCRRLFLFSISSYNNHAIILATLPWGFKYDSSFDVLFIWGS